MKGISATNQCPPQRWRRTAAIFGLGLVLSGAAADEYSYHAPAKVVAEAMARLTNLQAEARQRFLAESNNPARAWELARACLDCAELAANHDQRAQFADAGIAAARRALALDPKLGAAWYYLGLNQGQSARTRKLTALGLLGDIEHSWQQAIRYDPTFDYAGPYRALGVLYRDAPGWPLSLGSRGGARTHLLKAVELAPGYPENQISLIESYLDWGEKAAVRAKIPSVQKILDAARKELTGGAWELSWHDWDHRWETIQSQAQFKAIHSPRDKN